jgi:hypothetical protein
MRKTITPGVLITGSLLAFIGPLSGQEVNSDVKIPPPREVVAGAPAINGILSGTALLFGSADPLFQGSSTQTPGRVLSEVQTREDFGDFMTSLLVKAGIITFDSPPTGLAVSGEDTEKGSRPAWTGRTPTTLSVSRTRRSASAQRR